MNLLITIPQGTTRDSFLTEETLFLLQAHFTVTLNEMTRNYTPLELSEAAAEADVLVTGWGTPHLGLAGLLTPSSKLKLIVHTGDTILILVLMKMVSPLSAVIPCMPNPQPKAP